MKKLVFLLTVLTIFSTLLSACAPQATPAPAPTQAAAAPTAAPAPTAVPTAVPTVAPTVAPTAAPIAITYWAFGSEGSAMADGTLWTDWYAKIFDAYQKAHPGVTVNFALKGYDASGSTLVVDTAVAAGTPPDIYFDTKFRVKKYQDAKLLEDLTPALTPRRSCCL